MAPARKGNTYEKAKGTLAAVVLADSFTQRFRPVTLRHAKVQLPLVNAAMIDYTLEWLAWAGVEEVWLFCCAHADQVQRHLADAHWLGRQDMAVNTIVSSGCQSVGDALRHVDRMDIIQDDFVLVSGDCVSNMRLGDMVALHQKRREKSKSAIMTMAFQPGASLLTQRRRGEVAHVCVLNGSRLLRYEDLERSRMRGNYMAVDAALFGEHDDIQVRCDLMDCNLYVCAPEVLMLFTDNFDYQNIRRDFVSGVLSEEELGNELHVYELKGEYAAWVRTMRGYDAVSQDVLQRWSYPFVADTNVLPTHEGRGQYRRFRHNLSREMVRVKRNTELYPDCAIGDNTTIGANADISSSVLGKNCCIGAGVLLRNAYLMDDVTVEEGARVEHSLLCRKAVVKKNAVVEGGTIVTYKSVVGEGHRVAPGSCISLCRAAEAEGSFSDDELETPSAGDAVAAPDPRVGVSPGHLVEAAAAARAGGAQGPPVDPPFDADLVGPLGAGYRWIRTESAGEVVRTSIGLPPPLTESVLYEAGAPTTATAAAPARPDLDSSADMAHMEAGGLDADDSGSEKGEGPSDEEFRKEVEETFVRAVLGGFSLDNLVIEINGLKIAENRTFADCARYIYSTLLDLCLPAPPWFPPASEAAALFPPDHPDVHTPLGKLELLKRFKSQITRWAPLLARFVKGEDEQVDLLLTMEEYCAEEGEYRSNAGRGASMAVVFRELCQLLYNLDVVSEEAFLAWAEEKQAAEEQDKRFLKLAQPFVDWLQEAEEDEDEDDEGGEDDDNDDDGEESEEQ